MTRRGPEPELPASKRVLVIGPFPPPVHGQALLNELIVKQLEASGHTVQPWHIMGATTTDDIGIGRGGKAIKFLAGLPVELARARRFRPTHAISTIGVADSMAVAVRDCVTPWLVRLFTGCTTFGYLTGMASPDLLDQPRARAGLAKLLRLFDYLIEPYKGTARVVDESLEATVIPYCSDPPDEVRDLAPTDLPRVADEGSSPRPFRVLHLANLYPAKGATRLLEAVALLIERELAVEVVIAGGDTAEQTSDDLVAATRALGLSDVAHIAGPVRPDDRWDLLLGADAMCLATDYRAEIMPLTLIDALAAGLGIVSTNWRGISPTLSECAAVELVAEPRPELIADAIERLMQRSRAEVADEARTFFENRLSVDRFGESLNGLLRHQAR